MRNVLQIHKVIRVLKVQSRGQHRYRIPCIVTWVALLVGSMYFMNFMDNFSRNIQVYWRKSCNLYNCSGCWIGVQQKKFKIRHKKPLSRWKLQSNNLKIFGCHIMHMSLRKIVKSNKQKNIYLLVVRIQSIWKSIHIKVTKF